LVLAGFGHFLCHCPRHWAHAWTSERHDHAALAIEIFLAFFILPVDWILHAFFALVRDAARAGCENLFEFRGESKGRRAVPVEGEREGNGDEVRMEMRRVGGAGGQRRPHENLPCALAVAAVAAAAAVAAWPYFQQRAT